MQGEVTAHLVEPPLARSVAFQGDRLTVWLQDGRMIAVPVHWYPRLQAATADERKQWELIGDGVGIHWPLLDEDIEIVALIEGRASGEHPQHFASWLRRHEMRRGPASVRQEPVSVLRGVRKAAAYIIRLGRGGRPH